ncbi:MAG: anti-sigma factor antagonist [Mycobacterium sp.]|nr:MAG: anti-sigma factor antagonist [Mycobacterium sp.]
MVELTKSPGPNRTVVVQPKGRLNMSVAPALRQELIDLILAGSTRLVVDLVDVDTIDSSALGTLLAGLKAARKAGGDLRIVSPSSQVAEVLRMTNLEQVLPTYASVDSAFES